MISWYMAILTIMMSGIKEWRDWDKYQVIMWSTGEPKDMDTWIKRLKEMGCTGEECYSGRDPSPFVSNQFGFYVENLIPQLAFLHSRRKLYDDDFQGYTATRDKKFLLRKPCFDDPAFWEEIEPRLKNMVRPFVPRKPLAYDLRDELSIGSFASPMDYCFDPRTISAFREWLKSQYVSLENLNREWDMDFTSWDNVEPMTTYEIKDREREALKAGKPENYAPWADHREFMDLTFAQTLGRMRDIIHEIDPDAPVGIEGTQMPSAWGGYDLWRLSKVIDWIEPYDIACSRKIFRSFLPPKAPILGTVFGTDYHRLSRKLWWLLLNGDKGCIIWDDEKSRCIEKDKDGLPLTERGKNLEPIFTELKNIAPTIFKLRRLDDRIAIHYSQASIRAHWMFDSRADRDTWPRRFSSYEAKHSRLAKVRDSFLRVIEDLSFQCNFVSYEEVEAGKLIEAGYKVLLLPQSVAMSSRECEQIEEFARAGGIVIADNMTATMDEHCKRLSKGQLDDLFGIHRVQVGWRGEGEAFYLPKSVEDAIPLQVYEPDITLTTGNAKHIVQNIPAVIENKVGKGSAIYLNLDIHDYSKHRLGPSKGDNYQLLFRQLLQSAGIESPVKVIDSLSNQPVPCVEIWRYEGDDADYVAFMRNAEYDADSLGHAGDNNNLEIEKPIPVSVILPQKREIIEIRTGKVFGLTDKIALELDPWKPIILKLGK